MLLFDQRGFLPANAPIKVSLGEFEEIFVHSFVDSNTRKQIYVNYMRWLESFQNRVSRNFVQWIDGSFVSQLQNPNDLDLVTFLDYRTYEAQEPFLDKYWCFSLEDEKLDSYLVKVYPENHPFHEEITLKHQRDWTEIYSKSKENQEGIHFPKGFLQIKFER